MADAMYAPVVTRFKTYDVTLDDRLARYSNQILSMQELQEWTAAALQEPGATSRSWRFILGSEGCRFSTLQAHRDEAVALAVQVADGFPSVRGDERRCA